MARNSPRPTDNDHPIEDKYEEIVRNQEQRRRAAEQYLECLLDDITIAVVYEIHRETKNEVKELIRVKEEELPPNNMFAATSNFIDKHECSCKKCDKYFLASSFSEHLHTCMGMGSLRPRNAKRRATSNKRVTTSYLEVSSEEEKDLFWNSTDKKRKKKEKNRSRKSKGTPKKSRELDPGESLIDVEGEADDILSLRDLLQNYARGSSPAASVSSSGSVKRRDRSRNKRRKDRSPTACSF